MPTPICLGETIVLNVDLISGATYNWSASSSDAGLVDTDQESTTMTPTQSGSYTISVSLTIMGCESELTSIEVVVNPLPATPIAANITSTDPTSCETDDGTITITGYTPNADYQILYSYNGGLPILTGTTADATGAINLNNLPAGEYSGFMVTDENDCTSGAFAGVITLTQPGAPAAPGGISGLPNPVCLGNTVDLSVTNSPGATYDWTVNSAFAGLTSGTGNTAQLNPTASGIITVSVTQTISGCQSPPTEIDILVLEDCLNPDFGVTYNNITLDGDLSTNDAVGDALIYGNPLPIGINPTSALPTVNSQGEYTFTTTTTGEWYFSVEVCDPSSGTGGNSCSRVPLAITVLDIESSDNPPVGNHDYINTFMNTSISIDVLSNDKCQSFPNCQISITSLVNGPFFGSFDINTQTYTPNNNFVGRDSFLYEICQTPTTSESCDQEWAYIDVFPGFANAFTNAMDDYNQTSINTPLTIDAQNGILSNDSDPINADQTVTAVNATVLGRGSIQINADGSYEFIPATDYIGPVDFEYVVCRTGITQICDEATLHLLVEPMAATGFVGSCVWEDTNGNGIFEPGEPSVANVPVALFDADGELVQETITDGTGNYLFSDVLQGIYFLQFETIDEYEFTIPNIGADNNDSDVDDSNGPGTTTQFTVAAGQSIEDFKAGLFNCTSIGDNVWYDVNENDIFDGVENGINGMQVVLWRRVNGQWVIWDETTTGQKPNSPSDDGWYEFCTAPGEYYVEVVLPPSGLVQARPFVGNNSFRDSDINNANGPGTTRSFNLINGVDKLDLGAGYYPEAVVGNLVWLDEDFDGIQDENEPRVEGVQVEVVDINTSEILGTSITNDQGVYMIDSLAKTDVYFRFTPPEELVATISGVGNNSIDSDVNHAYGLNTTGAISIQPNSTDNRIDFGVAFGALPVRWLGVGVVENDNTHLVSWKVDQEINVQEYVVLRRHESENEFSRVNDQTIKANDVFTVSDYSYVDRDIKLSGNYYYQIQQFDYDGKYNFSKKVSINRDIELETSLYPNPTISTSRLAFESIQDGLVDVSITDISGKVVKEIATEVNEGQNSIELDMYNILPGAYNVKIVVDGNTAIRRLIKIK